MALHRRTHTQRAVHQLQSAQTILAAAPSGATDVIPVPGIKLKDELIVVKDVTAANDSPNLAADYGIFVPVAGAAFDFNGSNPTVDEWVEIGNARFVFTDRAGQVVEENYPVGSNASIRRYVAIGAGAGDTAQNLVQQINDLYADEGPIGGFVASFVPGFAVRILSLVEGAQGVGIAVDVSSDWGYGGGGGWRTQDFAGPLAGLVTAYIAGEAEGIQRTSGTSDLTGATGGVEISFLPWDEQVYSIGTLVGNYGPGDPAFDSEAGDPENVGFGIGRMPPGWQP